MSGTSPSSIKKLASSITAEYFGKFINTTFSPLEIQVSPNKYKKHIPLANVKIVTCNDGFIQECEEALAYTISSNILEYECSRRIKLDSTYLFGRLEQIISGQIKSVRLLSGSWIDVDKDLKQVCKHLQAARGKYTFLYEDMFADIEPRRIKVPIIIDCSPTNLLKSTFTLDDFRNENEYHPSLRTKAKFLLSIIKKHKKEKGIVFTRNIRLSDALSAFLGQNNIKVFQVDGRIKSETERLNIVQKFQKGSPAVLIITRNTGRRGLDIPLADYSVLYSPKNDEYVVWQELSRIRSTIISRKPSYILYYSGTSEDQRLKRLVFDMEQSPHQYQFSKWTPPKE